MPRIVQKHSNSAAGTLSTFVVAVSVASALLGPANSTHAADPEDACQKGRLSAAGKYASCQQKVFAKQAGDGFSSDETFFAALSKCRVKYTGTWAKLQAKASGTGATCDNARYQTVGTETVIDRLTGLEWEQKTSDATVRDKDNTYSWGQPSPLNANGSAFTTFLEALNTVPCHADQCDWRLPTIYELQTILAEPYPCPPSGCIDQAFFVSPGPGGGIYWANTPEAGLSKRVWAVAFFSGALNSTSVGDPRWVRAVRGGL